MSSYEFLSPDWIAAALAIRDEFAADVGDAPAVVRMNLVVTQVPHGQNDTIEASIDTGLHGLTPQLGHLDNPELTITLEYDTARSLFVDQNPEAVGQAFFGGRIQIDGDMSRIFFLQSVQTTPEQQALAHQLNERLLEITV